MNDRKLLYTLLYEAMIIIREDAYTNGNEKIFRISNLLHNLPLKLERQGSDDAACQQIMEELKTKAEANGLARWLAYHQQQTTPDT